jgi:hypothetical protein
MRAVLSILLGRTTSHQGSQRPDAAGHRCRAACLAIVLLSPASAASAESVGVRFPEGEAHARLALLTPGGAQLAEGEWDQSVDGVDVRTRVVFHFRDGSLHDETVVFSQDGRFRLVRDHLVQTGPAFPFDLDLSVDGASGTVTVRTREKDGPERRYVEHLSLPSDLANGMVPTMLKNVRAESPPRSFSLLVATPKPRLVQLVLAPSRREHPTGAPGAPGITHYVLHVEIGGIAGRLAPLVGRQPPDSDVWIAEGNPPVYVRSDQPFYVGGPLWRIELVK